VAEKYSLSQIFQSINTATSTKLQIGRATAGHPGDKGAASESDWISLFDDYLPQRYQAISCHIIDSQNGISEQIDVAIVDRQFTPLMWKHNDIRVVPVESVYAVFEVKQELNKTHIEYAHKKIASVRGLHVASQPVPHQAASYPHKETFPVIGGILTLSSAYQPFCSDAAENVLMDRTYEQHMDIGCVANAGMFRLNPQAGYYDKAASNAPVAHFMLELIAQLQEHGTVPMIDIRAYAAWINT
jgi:hypothetical protein